MTQDQPSGPPATDPDTSLRLPADLRDLVERTIELAVSERWAGRIWERDTGLWTSEEEVAHIISGRLGWLDAPTVFLDEVTELAAFADAVAAEGHTDLVVCGMGGSSLAPEVIASILDGSESGLTIHVLDSTDPAAVRALEAALDPARTLRVIATKSGTTTETLAFLAHFWEAERHRVGRFPVSRAGQGFVAISDPGKPIEEIPHAGQFREVFLNPPDVGGRFSALTYVGLVPGALMGIDVEGFLREGQRMGERCRPDSGANPGLVLGAAMAALALAGRDKLTLVPEPEIAPLGAWLEQLIAESTGKAGMGIVPVDGEPLGPPSVYSADRVFVRIGAGGSEAWRSETDAPLAALEAAGHPIIDLVLDDDWSLAGEFFRWEFATAVAGVVLGTNPFDEPNVAESKQRTAEALEHWRKAHSLPVLEPLAEASWGRLQGGGVVGVDDAEARAGGVGTAAVGPAGDALEVLRAHLAKARELGYHAIGAYLAPTPERTAALRRIQALLRDGTRRAATLGYGPRFLHSTGQLHKGGAPIGCFWQLVGGHPHDLPIPGRKETFGTLIDAQALGDFGALVAHGLPVLRIDLGDDPDTSLAGLAQALEAALA